MFEHSTYPPNIQTASLGPSKYDSYFLDTYYVWRIKRYHEIPMVYFSYP